MADDITDGMGGGMGDAGGFGSGYGGDPESGWGSGWGNGSGGESTGNSAIAARVNGRSLLAQAERGAENGMGGSSAGGVSTSPGGAQNAGGYQLDVPPELGVSPEVLGDLQGEMRAMNLSQEQAQGVIALAAKNQREALDQYAQQVERWGMEVKADREMGGQRFEATQRYAVAALRSFDSDGRLFGLLEQSGYSNHPEVIRFLSRAGMALGEDRAALGNGRGELPPLHERLYGNTNNKG